MSHEVKIVFYLAVFALITVSVKSADAQFTETDLIRASNFGEKDYFGKAVDIDGDYAIVGAEEDGPSDNMTSAGAAYIFERQADGSWKEIEVLRASNADGSEENGSFGDEFGYSVAIDGEYAIVGARLEHGPSNNTERAGAAYIFEKQSDGTWQETQILRASDFAERDHFGVSVDLYGNYAVVGARGEEGPSDNARDTGAAYIFERQSDGSWSEEQILHASNSDGSDFFGAWTALGESRAVVGALFEDGPSNNTTDAGAAYVFNRISDGTWEEVEILRASNIGAEDSFGRSIAIDGGRVVVGAWQEDGPNDNKEDSGAAYVFERESDGSWQEVRILRASNADGTKENDSFGDQFGTSVSLSGDQIIIGARYEEGPSNDENGAGAAYFFQLQSDGSWEEIEIIRASNAEGDPDRDYRGDEFGFAVALDGDRLIVGAEEEDGPSNSATDAGAAYAFEPSESIPVELASFTIRKVKEDVHLTWKTASEQNNSGFEIQRRISGEWKRISFVEGVGTTSKPQTYRLQDSDLPFDADSVKYRLKQIDTDGSTSLSGTRTLKIGTPNKVTLHAPFPNPTQAQATIRYTLPKKADVSIRIYDVMGRAVTTLQRGIEDAGREEIQVPTSDLSAGVYFVRLQAGEKMETKQLTVVR